MSRTLIPATLLLLSVAFAAPSTSAGSTSGKPTAPRNRTTAPKPADIDPSVSMEGLLAKDDPAAFPTAKGATLTGYAVQVEKEEDGDMHITLAEDKGETSTSKWVVTEVTPAWQKRSASLAPARLRSLVGKRILVTGWLYFDTSREDNDPRGTRWELHPVTSIRPAGSMAAKH